VGDSRLEKDSEEGVMGDSRSEKEGVEGVVVDSRSEKEGVEGVVVDSRSEKEGVEGVVVDWVTGNVLPLCMQDAEKGVVLLAVFTVKKIVRLFPWKRCCCSSACRVQRRTWCCWPP
jgi:hypothetical protein